MESKRAIIDILSENLYDISGEIERNIENQNEAYKNIVERIDLILKLYPKIDRMEYAEEGIYFELEELKALNELYLMGDTKRAYEEQEYYILGIRDCFEFIVPLLNIDIKKFEEKMKCQ